MAMESELRERYAQALARFAHAANHPAARYTHVLRPGQMIILDNNRFGHGRLPFPKTLIADARVHQAGGGGRGAPLAFGVPSAGPHLGWAPYSRRRA
ncbi:TauD/TfdA family dioxygenase [Streptomyces sp. NPDC005408]|uniref:TauD/TfdA family dioxygenase n=1 Tax=Streptomyces sp. NPDC005408 TaxID=3155341 RepID=UPI0033B4005F